MAKNNTVIYFTVQAFEKRDGDHLSDTCQIQVIDTTAEGALKKAKKLIKKTDYRVSAIVEEIVK